MKIIIDARMYGLENAGIGRYLVNLINQIEKIDQKDKYIILLRKKYFENLKFPKNFQKILADYPHYSFQEQIFLPLQLVKLKPDLVHFPHFNVPLFWSGKYVVTIHDLIKHESRGIETTTRSPFTYWFKHLLYLLIVNHAVKKACRIITPSYFWKKELVKRYNLKENKIRVTYEGVDENLLGSKSNIKPTTILAKYNIQKPFVIYTGSLYPHKNVERLVMAVKKLNDLFRASARNKVLEQSKRFLNHDNKKLMLVIVCARNIFYERFLEKIKKLQAQDFVNLVGFVPDEDLSVIYKQAEVLVFPSFWEGFGLPGLEAMGVGLPVIAANASCLPEIYGEAALYFDPLNVEEMTEKILMVIRDKKLREDLVKKGFEQVKKYSWQKMARETIKVYQESLNS